jgi:hypothetical protein
MNEEKLKQILDKIGQADVPPNAALIAERASRNFDAALKIARPRQWYFTPIRLIAAAAVIVIVFAAGRWAQPPQTQLPLRNLAGYASSIPTHPTNQENENSFWRQKVLTAMKPRTYTQNQLSQTALLNIYKQHLKEK